MPVKKFFWKKPSDNLILFYALYKKKGKKKTLMQLLTSVFLNV